MVRAAYRKLCKLVAQQQRDFKVFPDLGKKNPQSKEVEQLPNTNDNDHSTNNETIVVDTQAEHCEGSTGPARARWPMRVRKARELAKEIVDMERHFQQRLKLVEERLNRMKLSGREFCCLSNNIAVESASDWSEAKLGDKSVDEPAGGCSEVELHLTGTGNMLQSGDASIDHRPRLLRFRDLNFRDCI